MKTCPYCHQADAAVTFEVRPGVPAHEACFIADDMADEAAMFGAMAVPRYAPETLATRYSPAPQRRRVACCTETRCLRPAARSGRCWMHIKHARREHIHARRAA